MEFFAMNNPVQPFLDSRGVLVLDGGLASELERAGCDLDDPLWSAKVLLELPEAISDVHSSYLEAGADCIISASYQATIEGFRARGLSVAAAEDAIRKSVQLAIDARDAFWADEGETGDRLRPLVAASVGPTAPTSQMVRSSPASTDSTNNHSWIFTSDGGGSSPRRGPISSPARPSHRCARRGPSPDC
jgi:S-methylmethionine-dependent homocysteine/selenocysteine methylase